MKDTDKASSGPSGFQRAMFVVSDAVLGAAVLILLGMWAGGFVDDKLHTGPWGSLGLSLLGGGLGLWRMVKKATSLDTPGTPQGAKPIPFKNEYENDYDAQDEKSNKSDS
ncbi:MAG: AtpZ/AtpI family protein [Candidatus Obscuribacterales bacterium]|nr:AtpZ/AtpI family protein [Candidatus Obscuribacterales bacterium]